MSDLNNKHLPSDIDSLTRKDLVEIYHIHAEEMQTAQKRIAELEEAMNEIVEAVLDNRSKQVTGKTLNVIRAAIDKFDLRRVYKGDTI